MALFGSDDKKNTVTSKKIRPTVMRIQNVAKELQAIAKSYGIKTDSIDFNILEIQTYVRTNEETAEKEWEEITEDDIFNLDDSGSLLDPYFQIKQMYEVEFFSKNISEDPFINFDTAIGANASRCRIYLSIKAGSQLTYSSRLEKELKLLIDKSKVRVGILIRIFDENVASVVSKLVAHVRVEESVTYAEKDTLLIAESYEPTLTIDDELIMHYDKVEELDEHTKKDYASRGFIKGVAKDELLIEYIKIQPGKPGRNCRGEFIAPKEAIEKNAPTFSFDETMREEDDPKSKKYIANESGYIACENNEYSIKTDVDLGEVSFRTTGNIISGVDSDVNISVKEKDAVKDAIGMGMEVEVTEIDVEGNVGSNAKLTAMRANISGQTHQSAVVKADKLDIYVHKGTAFGKKVHITRLEHGTVTGDTVKISQALGGTVTGKKINIELCTSHVKATSSYLIEVHKLQGSENTFIIDPLLASQNKDELSDNKKEIKHLQADLKTLEADNIKYTQLIKDGASAHNDVKKRLVHYKKNGIKMPESFVKKYKQFGLMQEQLKSIQESFSLKNNELKLLKSKTSSFQDDIFQARVINRDRWIGYNEIIFKLVKPKMDIVYKPIEGSSGQVFGLVEVEEGEYEIQVVDE